VEFNTIFHSN